MSTSSELLIEARTRAELSRKRLARLAGVPTSTVTRIEEGTTDPTVRMLRRLLAATGRSLVIDAGAPPTACIARLTNAWHTSPSGDEPDWTRLRALADHLRLHPEDTARAIEIAPAPSGSMRIDNLLAAIAEKLADDHDLDRPPWTAAIPPLTEPWESSGTPRMRQRETAGAAPQFLARAIRLSADNIWRRRG